MCVSQRFFVFFASISQYVIFFVRTHRPQSIGERILVIYLKGANPDYTRMNAFGTDFIANADKQLRYVNVGNHVV